MVKLQPEPVFAAGNAGQGRRATRFGFVAGLCLVAGALGAASFTASLDRSAVTLGENVALALTFEGGSPKNLPDIPPIPGLKVAPGVSHSSSQSFDFNGRFTSQVTYSITLVPQQVGDFTIPALTAEVGGQKMVSQPLTLKVVQAGSSVAVAGGTGEQLALIRLALPKKELYLGEVIVAELQIYLHSSVQNFGNVQLNGFPAEGFNVGKFVELERRNVRSGNADYTLVPFAVPLTPVKAGQWTLGPAGLSLVVELRSPNRRRDPFPDPFSSMFNEQKRLTLATEPESVQLLPLPSENVPADFKGAVGSYRLALTASPTNVTVGDPITVRVQISGRGALDAVVLPEQEGWRDFKTYPPTAKVELSNQLGVEGTKTFELGVVPQNADIRELPAFSFSYFDPEVKSYRTLKQPPVGLIVRPGGTTVVPSVAAAGRAPDQPPPAQDIIPIKQRQAGSGWGGVVLVERPWFLALQGAPVLALLGSIVWRKRGESLANNPRLRRRRQVAQIIRDGLNDLRRHAAENRSDDFFATLFRLLQERLGERLDLPASSITEAVIEEHLVPRGAPEPVVSPLRELFQTCNLARYAPIQTSRELAAVIPKAEAVLKQLQEVEL